MTSIRQYKILALLLFMYDAYTPAQAQAPGQASGQAQVKEKPFSQRQTGYLVNEIQGEVLWRRHFDVSWQFLIKGSFVADHSIVQVPSGSEVTLARGVLDEVSNKFAFVGGTESVIKISEPTIVRVGEDMLRKIKLSRYFVDELPKASASYREESQRFFLDEAWKRSVLFFQGQDQSGLGSGGSAGKDQKLLTTQQPIQMVSPSANSFLFQDNYPTSMKVEWVGVANSKSEKQQKKSYSVFLWRSDLQRPSIPIEITQQVSTHVNIPEAGSYFLQIESTDGQFISKPRRITYSSIKDEYLTGTKAIVSLMVPKPSTKFFTKSPMQEVYFRWVPMRRTPTDTTLVVEQQGKVVYSKNLGQKTSDSVALAPGKYIWHVRPTVAAKDAQLQSKTTLSEHRTFEVIPPSGNIDFTFVDQALSGLGKQTGDVVIYVE